MTQISILKKKQASLSANGLSPFLNTLAILEDATRFETSSPFWKTLAFWERALLSIFMKEKGFKTLQWMFYGLDSSFVEIILCEWECSTMLLMTQMSVFEKESEFVCEWACPYSHTTIHYLKGMVIGKVVKSNSEMTYLKPNLCLCILWKTIGIVTVSSVKIQHHPEDKIP